MPFKLDRSLYLTADKKTVVEEGDPRARFVLGVLGSEIPDEQAVELGLVEITRKDTRPLVQEDEPKAKEPAQNKVAAAKANKSATLRQAQDTASGRAQVIETSDGK